MERFDGPQGNEAFKTQIETELGHMSLSPASKERIKAVVAHRRASIPERVRAILDYEITLTLPQLGAGLAALTFAMSLYWTSCSG